MPIRHGGMFAIRASTWPRDHFCRSTIAPRRSNPTTWNEFLPRSMPIVAMVAIDLLDMAVIRLTLAPSQHHSPVGQEHGRTIPLPDSATIWPSRPRGRRPIPRLASKRCRNLADTDKETLDRLAQRPVLQRDDPGGIRGQIN